MFGLKRTCRHEWAPYRYNTMEFQAGRNVKQYNREGAYVLSHVFCCECGEIRQVVVEDNFVKYIPIS